MGGFVGFVVFLVVVVAVARFLNQRQSAPVINGGGSRAMDGKMRIKAREAKDRAHEEYRIELTYDRSSVKDLERILDDLRNNHLIEPYSENALAGESELWGAYVGEILRRIRRGKWRDRSRHAGRRPMPFVLNRQSEVFPCSWVYRRIKHGPEYSVDAKVREYTENRDNPAYASKA